MNRMVAVEVACMGSVPESNRHGTRLENRAGTMKLARN